ncbi:MAG: SMC family ATPase [Lachnospiraceae bacterium]|nr:SMC family ATPase [Lachnospiraceae bacterium]
MRPIKVEFQAFGPYPGYEKVDFEAISAKGLFLICGKTGIGKTMILDAMTFALYGKSSGSGRDNFESMRCTRAEFGTDTFVKFEFENNGEHYLFERRLECKKKNLHPSYNVAIKGADGIWNPLMENAKDDPVSKKAAEIIGLEYEQFRQVIVLPQGQFERLLTSNSNEKEKILTSIFGEEKWKAIADRFYAKAEGRKSELKVIQDRIRTSLSEEGCETMLELETVLAGKKEEAEALEENHKKADYEKIIKEQQGLLIIAKRFGDLHKAESKTAELKARKEERDGWEKTLSDAKRADKVRTLIEAEKAAAEALKKRKDEEEAAKTAAEAKKKAADDASEKVKLHAEREKDIEELKSKKILYEGKRNDYEGLDEAENELRDAKKAAESAASADMEAKKAYDSLSETVVRLQNENSSLLAEYNELMNAYIAGITGDLAKDLESGKPCPVCGSTEHPDKAKPAENAVTKAQVDSAKNRSDQKDKEVRKQAEEQDKAKKLSEEKHADAEKARSKVTVLSERLDGRKKNLVEGIPTAEKLEEAIAKLQTSVEEYEGLKTSLLEAEKKAKDEYIESKTKIGSAENETKAAAKTCDDAGCATEAGLKENGFASRDEAVSLMLSAEEMEQLSSRIAKYEADVRTADENLKSIAEELRNVKEPDEAKCQEILDSASAAQNEYIKKKALLTQEIERVEKKAGTLRRDGEGIEDKIREADEDLAFAKKLRGDTGIGLQRYVLGIMFSSVVASANRMLEKVHGGRYRLFRSDDRAQGSNKTGLELKVYDKNSKEHDGRFVGTLSGGEKFLASLALSIGMSTVAQKGGIKIDALFIDEGFGSLDEDSIEDAMNILNSIQESNGLVGIISHVQILQDQIPTKLRVEEDKNGSHIVEALG